MKRPKIDPASYYTLTEAARATGIPRGVLDHGCRNGRLPFRQTEGGIRLLSGTTVLQLARDRDLRSFPKAYEPSPGPAPNLGYEEEQTPQGRPAPPTAAQRIGLLSEPSPEIVRAKERAEAAKFKADEEKASLESAQISAARATLRKQIAAEEKAERQAAAAEQQAQAELRRQEAAHQRRAVQAQQECERRARWLKHQVELAIRNASFSDVPLEERADVKERIGAEVAEELEILSPDSHWSGCQRAREVAVHRVLGPYKIQFTIELALSKVREQIYDRYNGGWLNIGKADLEFLAQRLRPRVKAELEREAAARGYRLDILEASKLVRDAVDRELRIN